MPEPDSTRRRRLCAAAWGGAGLLAIAGWPLGIYARGLTVRVAFVFLLVFLGLLATAWAARKLKQFGLLLASSLLALVLFEVALRFIPGPHVRNEYKELFRFDPRLGWRFKPDSEAMVSSPYEYAVRIRINSAGFRDPEPTQPPPEALRIAVIGDSFVSNLQVEDDEVFTRLLDARLGEACQVRNFGINGYGQVQQRLLLEEVLADYRPTLVLVVLYVRNDFDDNLGLLDQARGYHRPQGRIGEDGKLEIVAEFAEHDPTAHTSLYETLANTCTHRLLRGLFLRRSTLESVPVAERPPEVRYCRLHPSNDEAQALALTNALVQEMARLSRESGARLALVVAPSPWQVEPATWANLLARYGLDEADYARDAPQQSLAAGCAGSGIPVLDLLTTFEQLAGKETEPLHFPWNQHWTPLGNERVAEGVASWLEAGGLLRRD